MNIKDKLGEAIKVAANVQKVSIEVPKDSSHGDFSTNIAMQLTQKLGKNPREIAEELILKIKEEYIEKAEIAGPGFINFYLKPDYLFENILEILTEKENFGKSNIGGNKKVNIEYVSANPTGTLHIGTARGASYGDNLSNILEFTGFDVTREYYINDAGNQIKNLGLSLKARYKEQLNMDFNLPEDGYHGEEIISLAKNLITEYNDKALEKADEFFEETAVKFLLDRIKKDLEEFRVEFDVWTSEKSIYKNGKVEKSLKKLKELNKTYEKDGAIWLKTSEYGDEKDRVIVKQDGTYTYLTPDIAYHLDKFDRGHELLIDVLGADHHGYISRLKAAVNALGYDDSDIDIKILQMVKLIRDNEVVKMSKRTGKTITIAELVDEVGVNAVRYFFAARSLDTQMEFDIDLATKKSNENPVYYVNYAYSRICSILKTRSIQEVTQKFESLNIKNAYNVLKKLNEFKDVVENSATRKEPHIITNYVYELASAFHSYYNLEKIITDDQKETNEKLALITAVKIVIKSSLNLIGVEPKEKM